MSLGLKMADQVEVVMKGRERPADAMENVMTSKEMVTEKRKAVGGREMKKQERKESLMVKEGRGEREKTSERTGG